MRNLLFYINFTLGLAFFLGPLRAQETWPKQFQKDLIKATNIAETRLSGIQPGDGISPRQELNGELFHVLDTDKKRLAYVYKGRVYSCRAGGCKIRSHLDRSEVSSEYFDYYIIYTLQGEVAFIRVFNYAATHGQEITARSWLKQFFGYDGSQNLEPGKNIDAISGATISVYAITADIEKVSAVVRQMMNKTASAHSR